MKSKVTVLCLSGWAQKFNSLESIFKDLDQDFEVISFDYSKFSDLDSFFMAVKNLNINPQIIAGWSLGGQLAVRLIAEKIFNPKLLIIIGSSFQFVKSKEIPAGMGQVAYNTFKTTFKNAPNWLLKKFSILMLMNDKHAKEMERDLEINAENHQSLEFWLDELGRFSCFDVDFSNFPRAILFYGDKDVIVHPSQGEIYAKQIPNSRLEIFKDCGHCPHLHDPQKMKNILKEEISLLSLK